MSFSSPVVYLLAAIGLVVYAVLAWLVTDVMKLSGDKATIVRALLMALGVAIVAVAVLVYRKRQSGKQDSAGTQGSATDLGAEALDPLFRDAEARLKASHLGKDARLGTLPMVVVLGDGGSAKTSVIVNSGAEAELLAGHVYQDGLIVPSQSANLWFARSAVILEAGGRTPDQPALWNSLLKRLKPAQMKAVLGSGRQAPRSAVVCVDAESLLRQSGGESATQTARRLNSKLQDMCREMGIQLPVYVLFTRCDRIPFFMEYVAQLSDEESRQVVGVTVPLAVNQRVGTYAEEETRRLTDAMSTLNFGLADYRPVLLKREHNAQSLPAVYELPREFRKLRTAMVQFMVELCRPSQLQSSPFLRGFYFSGVRPVEVRQVVQAQRPEQQAAMRSAEATGIFSMAAQQPAAPQARVQVRRVPQWLFLTRLFSDVILKDPAAFTASSHSVGTDSTRRVLLGAAAALALVFGTVWSVSYFRNQALQQEVADAVQGIGSISGAGQELPPVDTLRRLDVLRQSVEKLSAYHREGAPWSMRWGLYSGDDLLPTARRLYFSRFNQVLFGATQAGLVNWMRKLPATPAPTDDYGYTYDSLKAYLITTSHPDKSTKLFLTPVLMNRWAGDRKVDDERSKLAQAQFDFYAEELKHGNPFSKENDTLAIERARKYLAQFAGTERIYQFMLAEAGRKNPSINFNRMFPGSAQVIANNREISGAFSKGGWTFMMDAIKNWEKFFAGEEWVLGAQSASALDRSKVEPELAARYRADFLGNWREYLRYSSVLRYASLDDAAKKLGMLSNNTSYLLALFCVASANTSAATAEDVKGAFQPVQFVTPAPGCSDKYIDSANQPYMNGLIGLQTSLESVARVKDPNDPSVNMTLQQASQAKMAARQVAQNFRIDKEGHVEQMVQKLMEDPITHVEGLLGRLGPAQINGAGKAFCAEFQNLTKKYPFNTSAQADATLDEVNAIFRPGNGALWTFYEGNLKNHLVKQGSQFVPAPGAPVKITPQFLRFFNRAAAFSDALYRNGTVQEPQLNYTLKALPAEGIQRLTLQVDGQEFKSAGTGGGQATFQWPGSRARQARLLGSLGGPELGLLSYEGLWSVFRFFADADRWQPAGGGYNFDWVPRQGQSGQPMTLANGKPVTVRYFLDMGSTAPIFQKNYLSGFQCVSQAAQ